MAKPIEKGYATNRFLCDGVETLWEFDFVGGYLHRDHVLVYTRDPETKAVQIQTPEWLGDWQLKITPALAEGLSLFVQRDTPKAQPLVDFTAGALRTPENLAKDLQQALNVATEAMDAADVVVLVNDLDNRILEAERYAMQAITAAEAAELSRQIAEQSIAVSVPASQNADAKAAQAAASATAADGSKTAAASSASAAAGSATAASNSAAGAASSAGTASSEAGRAKTEADRAKSEADRAAQINGYETVEQIVDARVPPMITAQVTPVKSTADQAKAAAATAQTTADQAKTAASAAQTTADQAKTAATAAQSTANQAKTTADNALSRSGGGQVAGAVEVTAAPGVNYGCALAGYLPSGTTGKAFGAGFVGITNGFTVNLAANGKVLYDFSVGSAGGDLYFNGKNLGVWADVSSVAPYFSIVTVQNPTVTDSDWQQMNYKVASGRHIVSTYAQQNNDAYDYWGVYFVGTGTARQGLRCFYNRSDSNDFGVIIDGKLKVVGISYAQDHIGTSDIRKKDIKQQRYLTLEQILTLQLAVWEWKDGSGRSSGVIAQQVQKIMPELVHEDADGFLALAESKVALNLALSLAYHIKSIEDRINGS